MDILLFDSIFWRRRVALKLHAFSYRLTQICMYVLCEIELPACVKETSNNAN